MPSLKSLKSKSRLPEDRPIACAAASALLYVAIAIFYILVSGRIAAAFAVSLEQLQLIEAAKGVAFVVITGLLFFFISLGWWRKRREQRELLIQSERKAVASMYSATLAHDLNNLLMGLSSLVEAIKEHEQNDSFLSSLRASVEQMIRSLVPFSRRIAATAKNLPQGESVDVHFPGALTPIIDLALKHPDVKFCALSVENAVPVTLTLNAELLEQALLNLIVNAAHAAGPHGVIKVIAAKTDHSVALEVHDSGPGISPEKAEAIFNPGYTTKRAGIGLGLLTVQAFAASCQGRVRVERSPLGGALFRILIPLNPAPAKGAP